MSKAEVKRFIGEYLPDHPELKQKIEAHAKDQNFATRWTRAGVEAGFDFSEAELLETLREAPSSELSEGELEAVAGGSGVDPKRLAEKVAADKLAEYQLEIKLSEYYGKKIY